MIYEAVLFIWKINEHRKREIGRNDVSLDAFCVCAEFLPTEQSSWPSQPGWGFPFFSHLGNTISLSSSQQHKLM
jgi:hypothetical protein